LLGVLEVPVPGSEITAAPGADLIGLVEDMDDFDERQLGLLAPAMSRARWCVAVARPLVAWPPLGGSTEEVALARSHLLAEEGELLLQGEDRVLAARLGKSGRQCDDSFREAL